MKGAMISPAIGKALSAKMIIEGRESWIEPFHFVESIHPDAGTVAGKAGAIPSSDADQR